MKAMGPIPAQFSADEDARLKIGGWSADELIEQAGGTPLFVYDNIIAGGQVARFRAAMPDGLALHYAVKANPYGPLLRFLARHVDGFDIASAGELRMLEEAEVAGLPVSFAGPGKRDGEIELAIAANVTLNVESEGEAERALTIAGRAGRQPRIAVRVNPPFGIKGSGMKMGGLASPFGVDADRAPALVRRVIDDGAEWRGLHIFAGSQVLAADALIEAQRATVALAAEIADAAGAAPPELNLGGGFGIPYFPGEQPLDVEAVGAALAETLGGAPDVLAETRFAIELGRWLVGEAGVYLARIIDRKESGGRTFLVTDGGLHHMLAASGNFGQLLRRNYPVAIAGRFGCEPDEQVTVTGCLCTPLDLLADDVSLPHAEPGDIMAIFCAGAYGLTASPQAFLGQPPAREVLV
ncbi:pyridoxal-dependent decarboxylase, exosortase A system-associated [Sphingomonas sp.]|uniref:pyridoxal-dependent decarboxylase, exosortase A system-associated n=1 Tax=Sphingomonas sp. TaxID=28214 RepID=UPI00185449D5|nr:pyridoxal-dependent decarboxylase, exosortase A system-associated [Sphingomonas sp.]MBA3512089.1 pyridoxal-dependent decarboxylase, exosortase A system-associated [Sphingomonas sp.]